MQKNKFIQFFAIVRQMFDRYQMQRKLSVLLTIFAIVMGFITYSVLTGQTFFTTKTSSVFWLLVIDLSILFLLCVIIARKLVKLWFTYKKGYSASRLHVKLTAFFGLLAVTPAIIMAIFSTLFFHYGVHTWFSDQVKKGLNESLSVAKSYLEEHQRVITRDARIMAQDIASNAEVFKQPQEEVDNFLSLISNIRNMTEAIILDENLHIVGRSNLTIALGFEVFPADAIKEAENGGVSLLTSKDKNRVRAIVQLSSDPPRYLYVGRYIDQNVLAHLKKTENIVKTHHKLELSHSHFEVTFVLIYAVVGLLLLLASIWMGLIIAAQIAHPIEELIQAANRMAQGDLTARVGATAKADELSILSRSFNNMAEKLSSQQVALKKANRSFEEKSRLVESVLAGVSAGVISLTPKKRLKLVNESAKRLLKKPLATSYGKAIATVVPEFSELLMQQGQRDSFEKEIQIIVDNEPHTFLVNILVEREGRRRVGYVITFDDVSDLIYAQQQAAWAEVARRIAHEVKNPLTPIQLSTERLQKKYGHQLAKEEQPIFKECIQTILKYVDQIRLLINEFSSFARMPAPKLQPLNINKVINEIIALQKQAYPDISFTITEKIKDAFIMGDDYQMRQVFTNIVINAISSIQENQSNAPLIECLIKKEGQNYIITIKDNGKGLPSNVHAADLIKPYVTYSEKGTGLGLAIVKKIVDDHHGSFKLESSAGGGACVTLKFMRLKR